MFENCSKFVDIPQTSNVEKKPSAGVTPIGESPADVIHCDLYFTERAKCCYMFVVKNTQKGDRNTGTKQ